MSPTKPLPIYEEILARWKKLLVMPRPVDQAKIAAALGRWALRATEKDRKVQHVARKNDLLALALALDLDLDLALDRALDLALALDLDLDLALDRALDLDLDLALALALDLDLDLALDLALALDLDRFPYWNYHWLIFNAAYAVAASKLGRADIFEKFLPIFEAMEAGLFCLWVGADELFAAALPTVASFDDRNRLHSTTGPAFRWLEDTEPQYHSAGVLVPEYVIMRPAEITAKKIAAERNVEVRRVMIDRYVGGQAKYLVDSGAKEIQRDDYGVLFRKDLPDDESILMVKCVNSTAEPDGSFKDYFLRVPPTIKTAREGLAWTFNMTESEYAPALQT